MNDTLKTIQDLVAKLDSALAAHRKASPGKDQFLLIAKCNLIGASESLQEHLKRFPDARTPTTAPVK